MSASCSPTDENQHGIERMARITIRSGGIWWFSQLLSGGELPGCHPPSHHWDRLQRRGGFHYLRIIPRLKFWIKSTYLSTQVNIFFNSSHRICQLKSTYLSTQVNREKEKSRSLLKTMHIAQCSGIVQHISDKIFPPPLTARTPFIIKRKQYDDTRTICWGAISLEFKMEATLRYKLWFPI